MQKQPLIYTIDDDIEALFYTLVYVASDNNVIWNKGVEESASNYLALKRHAVVYFWLQLHHAEVAFHPYLQGFHDLLFDGAGVRKHVDIDRVISAFTEWLDRISSHDSDIVRV